MTRPAKRLFTPGPLTTSAAVKEAMLRDAGSRDQEFIALVSQIREDLLAIAGVSRQTGYQTIPMQGSGTFAVEAVLSCAVPRDGKLLVLANGAYGERMLEIARRHAIPAIALRWPEHQPAQPEEVQQALAGDPAITHVAVVHCETTTGLLNPVEEIGVIVNRHRRQYVVDAMSSFGAIPVHLPRAGIHFLISSANKCLEGVPGFSFILAEHQALLKCQGQARTLSLDLFDQWQGLEKNGQFRFTPPTHALLAFARALQEFEEEGGLVGRAARYQANHETLLRGMYGLGFRPCLPPQRQSCILTTFHYPQDPAFAFEPFYQRLAERGFVIYPGKLTQVDCFRIGTIGRLYPKDFEALTQAIDEVLRAMGCQVPVAG